MEIPLLDTVLLQVVQIACVSLFPLLSDVHNLRQRLMVPRCPVSGRFEWFPSFLPAMIWKFAQ